MSSFYSKEGSPEPGDIATTARYGQVRLKGQVQLTYETYGNDNIWVVEDENEELHLIREGDLGDIGFYGD